MGRLEGIWRVYKPLSWLLVAFLAGTVAFLAGTVAEGLLQECVQGILKGKSCKWQPT